MDVLMYIIWTSLKRTVSGKGGYLESQFKEKSAQFYSFYSAQYFMKEWAKVHWVIECRILIAFRGHFEQNISMCILSKLDDFMQLCNKLYSNLKGLSWVTQVFFRVSRILFFSVQLWMS